MPIRSAATLIGLLHPATRRVLRLLVSRNGRCNPTPRSRKKLLPPILLSHRTTHFHTSCWSRLAVCLVVQRPLQFPVIPKGRRASCFSKSALTGQSTRTYRAVISALAVITATVHLGHSVLAHVDLTGKQGIPTEPTPQPCGRCLWCWSATGKRLALHLDGPPCKGRVLF